MAANKSATKIADEAGHVALGAPPNFLDDDLRNVWEVINWVYAFREHPPTLDRPEGQTGKSSIYIA